MGLGTGTVGSGWQVILLSLVTMNASTSAAGSSVRSAARLSKKLDKSVVEKEYARLEG